MNRDRHVRTRDKSQLSQLVLRLVTGIALTAAVLFVVYVGGANLVLNTAVLDGVINKKREKLLVEWQAGSTFWPGLVHIEGLRIRGQAKKMQWQIALREGDFQLSLIGLMQRTIHIRGGSGASFSFVTRPRLDTMKDPPDEPPFWAEIDGLENPPDPPPEVLYPPKQRRREPWRIVVDRVTLTETTRFFIGPVQVVGQGTVVGGVDYRLRGGPLSVPVASMHLRDVGFAMKEQALVENGTLVLDAQLVSHMRAEARGRQILAKIVGSIDLAGDVKSLEVLNDYIPDASGFAFESGSGRLALAFDAPSVETSSASMKLDLPDGGLQLLDYPIRGDILVESSYVTEDRPNGVLRINNMAVRLDEVYGRDTWRRIQAGELEGEKMPDPWWAEFGIEEGRVAVGEPISIDVIGSVSMAATKPLLSLFVDFEAEAGRKAPEWLRMVPNVSDLQGTMAAKIDEGGALIRDVDLEGQGLKLKAQMESSFGTTSGAMYIRFKGIPLGIELLPEGGKDFKLIRPLRWYRELTGSEVDDDLEDPQADAQQLATPS